MGRKLLIVLLVMISISLVSCQDQKTIIYTNDDPFTIEMEHDSLKILQLTDLHLTYGIDANDRATLNEIKVLVGGDDYDLVVISGDMTLSPQGESLFRKLIRVMEGLKTNWTFVFGNHETDFNSYNDFLNQIHDTEYLYFKVGPELDQGGVGNFEINFTKDGVPFYSVYLMDSHAERKNYTEEEGEYDYIKESQVDWYESHVSLDTTDSVMFMHIPLRQFIDATNYIGFFEEDKVYAQGVDTGLFDAIVAHGLTKGVFVGHDHLNDFSFEKDGVLLAYGQITGYNAYGDLPRGGRVIEVSETGVMSSYIVLESGEIIWN